MLLVLVVVVGALALPASTSAVLPSVVDDPNGGTPWSCAWNPYARVACNGPSCWWVGEFQWLDPFGNFTGARCA